MDLRKHVSGGGVGRGRITSWRPLTLLCSQPLNQLGGGPGPANLTVLPCSSRHRERPYRGVKVSRRCPKVNLPAFLSLGGAAAPWWQHASPAGHFSSEKGFYMPCLYV